MQRTRGIIGGTRTDPVALLRALGTARLARATLALGATPDPGAFYPRDLRVECLAFRGRGLRLRTRGATDPGGNTEAHECRDEDQRPSF